MKQLIDPISQNKVNIFSKKGITILKNYIKTLNGGNPNNKPCMLLIKADW